MEIVDKVNFSVHDNFQFLGNKQSHGKPKIWSVQYCNEDTKYLLCKIHKLE